MAIGRHSLWLLLAFGLACTKFVDAPATPPCKPECGTGERCTNGQCVPISLDVPHPDAAPEVVDAVDASDLAPEVPVDAPPDRPPEDLPDPLEPPPDASADTGPVAGAPCQEDGECGPGQSCIPLSPDGDPDHKVCTGPCKPGCPDGTWCAVTAREGSQFAVRCVPFAQGLCARCSTPADCARPDARCEAMSGGSYCTHPCDAEGACTPGFTCQAGAGGSRCVPIAGTCSCTEALAGQSFQCEIQNLHGRCRGTLACVAGEGWSCDARLAEPEACDGVDNNCDGRTDENFVLRDWDGRVRGLGEPCGTGACAGGTVQCLDPDRAGCSTDPKRLAQEACGQGWGDGVDDDCDGVTDDGCVSPDLDGDGDPNATDCGPTDPAFRHPTPERPVAEPCCPPSTPLPDQVARCDRDCDGLVTICAPDDRDFDGYVAVGARYPDLRPGDDCDDADSSVHPDAPDRCDDGRDQDCDGADLHCCLPGQPDCTGALDSDGDGYAGKYDCNDGDPSIHPGSPESCDGVDQDCDGVTDGGEPGGQDPGSGVFVGGGTPCGPTAGECTPGRWTCTAYPGGIHRMECVGAKGPVAESCNGRDDNCDGATDEAFPTLGQACDSDDADRCANGTWTCSADGFEAVCIEAFGQADLLETCGNGKDDDCDGETDNGCLPVKDLDGDGSVPPLDCDDTRAEFRPGVPEGCCDPSLMLADALKLCDRNCDGHVVQCSTRDRDFDGFVDVAFSYADGRPGDDCDDTDPTVHPGAPERCDDGKDQDCNGSDLACCAPGVGGCTGPVDADGDGFAAGTDCNDNDPGIHPGAPELCNGKDEDCDGITDNGNPGTSPIPCGPEAGECVPGAEICAHYASGARVVCAVVRGPAREVCNGKDDNCNGRTDEAFPDLGLPCDGPDGDQCRNGTYVCAADGSGVECSPEIHTDIAETCNGLDDDCDGQTDEDFSYDGTAVGGDCDGTGECGTGFVVCAGDGTRATCSTNPDGNQVQAAPELCDGLDNDCDGVTDGGVNWHGWLLGDLCRGIGACGVGIVECNPATRQATCSTNPDGTRPGMRPEVCNGLDDDCDGHTDENLVPSSLDCKHRGVCAGIAIPATCARGQWVCDYGVVPGYEGDAERTCDGLDNDCNGLTDEGFGVGEACDGPDSDLCKNGLTTCKADGTGVECRFEARTDLKELCNGKDDDCDGRADEDFPVGERCDGPDSDQCKNGSYLCKADGSGVECRNEVYTDLQESCNGKDDDCNGVTDDGFAWEGLPAGAPCDGTGACGPGKVVCAGPATAVCSTNPDGPDSQAKPELCNGLDDDCDGLTDEDFAYEGAALGAACKGIGACGDGTVVCNVLGNAATCSSNPDAPGSQFGNEVCDGIDNNCDGRTDEDQSWSGKPLGADCTAPGVCGPGKVVCSPTKRVATCSTLADGTTPKAGPETCNQLDDDCNGLTDDFPNGPSGDPTGCTIGGVCRADLVVARCEAGGWVCDYSKVVGREVPDERTCDGLDNDCDGKTDEPWHIGEPCDGPDSDQCARGTWICNAARDGGICGPETVTDIVETCNGQDDDCDGQTDEDGATGCIHYYLDSDGDGFGTGTEKHCLCAPGAEPFPLFRAQTAGDCDDGDSGAWPGATERCNGKDDDCNGKTDDAAAFATKGQLCTAAPAPSTCLNGRWGCTADGTAVECQGAHVGAEQCNGLDDDCDGSTDEDFHVAQATGQSCQDGGPVSCSGLPRVGDACDGVGECGLGKVVCVADLVAACSTNPNGTTPQNKAEICNQKDDDCDGVIDDGFAVGSLCDGPDADFCKQGTYTCTADKLGVECIEPNPPNPPTGEVCDNKDNNCDGSTDELFPDKGQKCDLNPSAPVPCATGVRTCNGAGTATVCTGWVECVPGDTCQDSHALTLPDDCMCGSKVCTRSVATWCDAGTCRCGTGPACSNLKTCKNANPSAPQDDPGWVCQ